MEIPKPLEKTLQESRKKMQTRVEEENARREKDQNDIRERIKYLQEHIASGDLTYDNPEQLALGLKNKSYFEQLVTLEKMIGQEILSPQKAIDLFRHSLDS